MLNPVEEKVFSTIDELLESEMKLKHDLIFEVLQQANPKYQRAVKDGRVIKFEESSDWTGQLVEMNCAKFVPCKPYKNEIEHDGDGKKYKNLYLIPDVAFTQREDFYSCPYHPYIDILQELMDQTFEAGLHQAWEKTFYQIYTTLNSVRKPEKTGKEDLDFDAIIPFFLILAVGFLAALIALLCEIFFHDFVTELSKDYFRRKFSELFGTEIKIN